MNARQAAPSSGTLRGRAAEQTSVLPGPGTVIETSAHGEAGRLHCNTRCGAEMQMCVLIVASETLNVSAIKDDSEIFKKLL